MKTSIRLWLSAVAAFAAPPTWLAAAHAAAPVSVVYQFTGAADGDGSSVALLASPSAPLAAGTILGVSDTAGATKVCAGGPCGRIFALTPPATTGAPYAFTTLYDFRGGLDGGKPNVDSLLQGPDGSLYGTTQAGGKAFFPAGGGVVWKLAPPASTGGAWTYSVLWSFKQAGDAAGYAPVAGLAMDSAGVLYGMTTNGAKNGSGSVFSLTPPVSPATTWTETVLSAFAAKAKPTDVSSAVRAPILSANETRLFGPAAANGTIFELHRPSTTSSVWIYKKIFGFTNASVRLSNLLIYPGGPKGSVYGVVSPTSSHGGEAFQLTQPATGSGPWTATDLFDFYTQPSIKLIPKGVPVGGIIAGANTFSLTGTVGTPGDAVYRLTPPPTGSTTWGAATLATLDTTTLGVVQPTGLFAGVGGTLLGVSTSGGTSNKGIVFEVRP